MSRIVPRAQAIQVLTRVLSDFQFLDEALEAGAQGLTQPDRAWLQEVCSGVLRSKGRLDFIIDQNSLKKKPTGWLRKVLEIAVYQLLELDSVSDSSVVFETVELIKKKEGEAPAKFANALLRKIAAHSKAWKETPMTEETSSLPHWIFKRVSKAASKEKAIEFAKACLARPKFYLRTKSGETQELQSIGNISENPMIREGTAIVQDLSSQTLVREVAALLKSGARVLDLCSAPGGKAIGLAWSGFQVTAADRTEDRLKMVQMNALRTHVEIPTLLSDRVFASQDKFDAIWIDAPCTGTGTLRKNPEIRWLKTEKDLKSLCDIQFTLLKSAVKHVAPGGKLIYSVCSVLPEEGELQIKALLAEVTQRKHSILKSYSLWPQTEPYGDGFYAAIIEFS